MTRTSQEVRDDQDVQIREAVAADAAAIIHFLRQASQESDAVLIAGLDHLTVASEADNLATIQNSSDCEVVIATLAEHVIGVATIMVVGEQPQQGELGVVVERQYWHNGIGSALLDVILVWYQHGSSLQELVLDVFADNHRAIRLYRHYGFRELQRGQGKDAHGLMKELIHMSY